MINYDALYTLIGSNFKRIRMKKIGLTQEKLAEELNLSRSFISHIESEQRSFVRYFIFNISKIQYRYKRFFSRL